MKNWTQGLHLKKGALRKELGVSKKTGKIPVSRIEKASKETGIVGKRARLALAFRKMKH
jgi:hypothetical protein